MAAIKPTMEIGLKDRWKYKDISWLMRDVNVEDVLVRLQSPIDSKSVKEIRAFCPDHYLFTGRPPSHPNWTVNVRTGETMCFTEGRGSNLLWTVRRIFDCDVRDAIKFLTNSESDLDMVNINMSAIRHRISQIREQGEERLPVNGLDAIAREIENRHMSEAAYRFFIQPPGKKYPTNILSETVDRYWVFERTWGYYTNRVIIPFATRGVLDGFCALDILGKDVWLRRHPLKTEDDYKKVLYPANFVSGNFLFGLDDCQPEAEFVVVTEGAREVMKLWQEGFPNSVAILGSYLSDNQMNMLTRLNPKRVVLMFDGDDSGVRTMSRIRDKLKRTLGNSMEGRESRIQSCFVPRGRDPKNLSRADFEAMIYGTK